MQSQRDDRNFTVTFSERSVTPVVATETCDDLPNPVQPRFVLSRNKPSPSPIKSCLLASFSSPKASSEALLNPATPSPVTPSVAKLVQPPKRKPKSVQRIIQVSPYVISPPHPALHPAPIVSLPDATPLSIIAPAPHETPLQFHYISQSEAQDQQFYYDQALDTDLEIQYPRQQQQQSHYLVAGDCAEELVVESGQVVAHEDESGNLQYYVQQ